MQSVWSLDRSWRRPGQAGTRGAGPPAGPGRRGDAKARLRSARLLLDHGEHVTGGEDEVLLVRVLHLGAAVLAVQDGVADLDVHRDALGPGVVEPARPDGDDLALLWLLLRGVRDDQPGRRGLLGVERADHDPVFERLDNNLGGGRHDLTSPCVKG